MFWLVNHVRSHAWTTATSASRLGKSFMKTMLDEVALVESVFEDSEYLSRQLLVFSKFGDE